MPPSSIKPLGLLVTLVLHENIPEVSVLFMSLMCYSLMFPVLLRDGLEYKLMLDIMADDCL
jgi:hypothetical protein